MKLQDIYNLQHPERYYCELWFFTVSHTELYVQVVMDREFQNPDKVFYMGFTGTHYYDGPMKWQGLKLRNGTRQEYIDLWRIIYPELAEDPPSEEELSAVEMHMLHIFDTKLGKVRIYSSPPFVVPYDEFDINPNYLGDKG